MDFRRKSWCCSPNCVGKCNRKLSDKDMTLSQALGEDRFMTFGYFCGYPDYMSNFERMKARLHCVRDRLRQR